jgi:hypothetical protein
MQFSSRIGLGEAGLAQSGAGRSVQKRTFAPIAQSCESPAKFFACKKRRTCGAVMRDPLRKCGDQPIPAAATLIVRAILISDREVVNQQLAISCSESKEFF